MERVAIRPRGGGGGGGGGDVHRAQSQKCLNPKIILRSI